MWKQKAEISIWENAGKVWSIPSTCQMCTSAVTKFNEADNSVIEMRNSEHFRWMFDVTRYIAIVTDNPIAQGTVISFASCNCKGNIFLLEFVRWLFDYLDNHIFC